MKLNLLQSYYVMFKILDKYYWATKNDNLGGILGFMNPEISDNHCPVDPAVLEIWKNSVLKVTKEKEITSKEAFEAMIIFLEVYNNEFDFNIREVINELEKSFLKFDEEWGNGNR